MKIARCSHFLLKLAPLRTPTHGEVDSTNKHATGKVRPILGMVGRRVSLPRVFLLPAQFKYSRVLYRCLGILLSHHLIALSHNTSDLIFQCYCSRTCFSCSTKSLKLLTVHSTEALEYFPSKLPYTRSIYHRFAAFSGTLP